MRIKKIDNQQFIAFNIDEAYELKEMLYSLANSNGTRYQEDAKELADKLDDAILKAESK